MKKVKLPLLNTVNTISEEEYLKPVNKYNFFRLLAKTKTHENWYENNLERLENFFKETAFKKNSSAIINVKNVTKIYSNMITGKTNVVFENISFKINQNEVVSLLGSNGAGKSTLMDIIVGFKQATSGTVTYGIKFDRTPTEKIGVSFQKNIFLDSLTVWDYIRFVYTIYHSKLNLFVLIMYVYAFGLDEFCNAKANSLSGGQQQRLNVMLSLFHNPEILMFDELANNLDINIKKKILTFINLYIKSKNCTAIIISHDPLEINELATRIIFLSHGSIELDESKASVLKKYKTIGSFLEAKVG